MLASELIKTYEEFCPQELSMEGDVVGLQIGSLDKEIQKVMVTLDVRENTVVEAIEKGVDLIIAKHAPIFRPVKDLVSSPDRDILLDLVKHDIAVYVSHTNIDVVNDGLNDWFCDLLDIKDTTYLTQTSENHGIGRVGDIVPQTIEEKKKLLLEHGIAIWDVIESCDIIGSSDSSIKNVVPADIERVVANSKIQNIYANGGTAKKLYEKYSQKKTGREIIGLPSTSPANAAYSLERLLECWQEVKKGL